MLNEQTLADLRALGDDDPEFFKSLLQAFLESLTSRLPPIKQAIEQKSGDKLALAAHALKSSCCNLGAQKLGDFCQELEKIGKAGSTDGADAIYVQLSREADAVKNEVNALPEMKSDV